MVEEVFYASDIEYQQLEDDVMGTTFDLLPYHPDYARYQEPYYPHWQIIGDVDVPSSTLTTDIEIDGTDEDVLYGGVTPETIEENSRLHIDGIDQENYFDNTTIGRGGFRPDTTTHGSKGGYKPDKTIRYK